MIGTKKQIKKAVQESNLLQWVESQMLKWNVNHDEDVMDVAERIIKRVRESNQH